MDKKDFFYTLPENLIAQHPLTPRDSSKLLVFDRYNKEICEKTFADIIDFLNKGDLLVINNTKVIPARLFGKKKDTGASIELLLMKRKNLTDWTALVRPAKRLKVGSCIFISDDLSAIIIDSQDEGVKLVRFEFDGVFEDILDKLGQIPLPHYIKEKLSDKSKYQTVYAKTEGSCAAPTAGLHFTEELIKKLRDKGIEFAEVLLHIGLGTFRPVKAERIEDHNMHSEYYEIDEYNAGKINKALSENRRVISVGTTSVRVLESAAENGRVKASCGNTNIFIYPPYEFKIVKALITNFHLPESTLIMLVSAFCGREETLKLYNYAVEQGYRFFSFGDAMFLK